MDEAVCESGERNGWWQEETKHIFFFFFKADVYVGNKWTA